MNKLVRLGFERRNIRPGICEDLIVKPWIVLVQLLGEAVCKTDDCARIRAFDAEHLHAFPTCAVIRVVVLRNIYSKEIFSDNKSGGKLSLDIVTDIGAAQLIHILIGIANLLTHNIDFRESVKSVAAVNHSAVGILRRRGIALFVFIRAP